MTQAIASQPCSKCISDGNRYCFVKFIQKSVEMTNYRIPVTSGNGKCCSSGDHATPGCSQQSLDHFSEDPTYANYTLELVCTQGIQNRTMGNTYEAFNKQPIVANSSVPYEQCPHVPEQCDAS